MKRGFLTAAFKIDNMGVVFPYRFTKTKDSITYHGPLLPVKIDVLISACPGSSVNPNVGAVGAVILE